MHDDETIKRAREIHNLVQEGKPKEAKSKFKKLVEETMSYCKHCKKYVQIELDKSTNKKPFYFCVQCGQKIKQLDIKEDRLIDLKFHKGK
jgi:hypothetical protein